MSALNNQRVYGLEVKASLEHDASDALSQAPLLVSMEVSISTKLGLVCLDSFFKKENKAQTHSFKFSKILISISLISIFISYFREGKVGDFQLPKKMT